MGQCTATSKEQDNAVSVFVLRVKLYANGMEELLAVLQSAIKIHLDMEHMKKLLVKPCLMMKYNMLIPWI